MDIVRFTKASAMMGVQEHELATVTGIERCYDERGASYFLAGPMGERLLQEVDKWAVRARMSRGVFLQMPCGLAAVLLGINRIAGMQLFDVDEVEAYDIEAARARDDDRHARMGFVVDVHTHVCWRKDGLVERKNVTSSGMHFVDDMDGIGKAHGLVNGIRDMTIDNFGRLILEGSDTTIAIFNPFGFREDYGGRDLMPLDEQAEIRERWPDRTLMLGGGFSPNQGLEQALERVHELVEVYRVSGLKLYTFDSTPGRGWFMDDVALAYPLWERCRQLGLKNVACHKGFPFGKYLARYAHPGDFDAVAEDFPDMNWVVFHSAWPYHHELAALKAHKKHRKNLYCELGGTFAATITSRPIETAHVVGKLLRDIGEDYVMWGTDSIIWGSPQWQIDAFRRFRIPDELVMGYGYTPLSDDVKRKVLGGNAARLWGLGNA